jgi:hypothetical protein
MGKKADQKHFQRSRMRTSEIQFSKNVMRTVVKISKINLFRSLEIN